MVSTHLKNTSQIGSFPQIGVKIKNIWNHHRDNQQPQLVAPLNLPQEQPVDQISYRFQKSDTTNEIS